MRQLLLWVPPDRGEEVRARADAAGATHTLWFSGQAGDRPAQLLLVHTPNDRLDDVLAALEPIEELRLAFQRDSVVLLEPPPGELPDQVSDVSNRGPLEILVEGLQSLGGWVAFLTYSVVAGAVVWAGLVTETIFLLTAAMLIAPYAAPAMTAALATARGDALLLRRSVGRYVASIATTAVTAALLTIVAGVTEATSLMVEVADVSAVTVLLPLAAGVAGAVSFSRPDRTGIVSGAGVGMLVALALAPQAGLIGIAAVLGEERIAASASFVVVVQLLGINVAATAVLLLLGVGRRIPRARTGRTSVLAGTVVVTVAAVVAALALQWSVHPQLTRETVVTRAEAAATAVLDAHPGVVPVDSTARFPLADAMPEELLVVETRVLRSEGSADVAALEALVRDRLLADLPGTDPRVAVEVVGAGDGT